MVMTVLPTLLEEEVVAISVLKHVTLRVQVVSKLQAELVPQKQVVVVEGVLSSSTTPQSFGLVPLLQKEEVVPMVLVGLVQCT